MIIVRNLTRKYGDFVAVDDVSFSIEKGEIVGLLGHNGAGKTTVMKTITGFLEPNGGTVSVDGLDITANRLEVQEKIGYLPESSPLYPEMSVTQYLDYVSKLRGIPEEKRGSAIRTAIQKTQLTDKALSPIAHLSKGYRQRVGVAQAIMHSPDILILDEPTNGLDPAQIHEMRDLVTSLAKNATVILSTHILQEVEAVCDRVIIMVRGRIGADAKLKDLRSANRLSLVVNQDPHQVQAAFKGMDGVLSVECVANGGPRCEYRLDLDKHASQVAPAIAKAVIGKGWELYKLDQDSHNLESVFREISKGSKSAEGDSHA